MLFSRHFIKKLGKYEKTFEKGIDILSRVCYTLIKLKKQTKTTAAAAAERRHIMTKFEKVKSALIEKTRDTGNWVRLSEQADGRYNGKYTIQNIVTGSIVDGGYNTLDEVIEEYDLNIEA